MSGLYLIGILPGHEKYSNGCHLYHVHFFDTFVSHIITLPSFCISLSFVVHDIPLILLNNSNTTNVFLVSCNTWVIKANVWPQPCNPLITTMKDFENMSQQVMLVLCTYANWITVCLELEKLALIHARGCHLATDIFWGDFFKKYKWSLYLT